MKDSLIRYWDWIGIVNEIKKIKLHFCNQKLLFSSINMDIRKAKGCICLIWCFRTNMQQLHTNSFSLYWDFWLIRSITITQLLKLETIFTINGYLHQKKHKMHYVSCEHFFCKKIDLSCLVVWRSTFETWTRKSIANTK